MRSAETSQEQPLFTFDTTHHALWAEEVARLEGVPTEMVPAPPAANARCNLALVTLPEQVALLRGILREAGVPFALYPSPPEESPAL